MRDFKGNIKKYFKNIMFFVILAALLFVVTGFMEEAAKNNDDRLPSRNKNVIKIQKEPKNTIDVLVLGDSLGYSSISPMQMWEEYGFTSFVGCQYGQRIQESYCMLKTAFSTQKPKLVVLETNVVCRWQKGVDSVSTTLGAVGNHYLPIFAYHDIWKTFVSDKKYPENNFKGYLIRDGVRPYNGGEYMNETQEKAKLCDTEKEYLDEILNLCRKNNAELILVSVPSPVNYTFREHNTLVEYAGRNGLKYIDMNLKTDELGIEWDKDTKDKGDHLNLRGAIKVTGYLGGFIKDNYGLPDHRGDKEYRSWETEYEKYDKKVKQKLEIMQKK